MSVSLRRGRFAVFPALTAVLTALFTVTRRQPLLLNRGMACGS